MKITQLNRASLIPDDLNSTKTYRLIKMTDGTLKAIPMSKVSIKTFIDDLKNESVAYVEVEE